MSPAIYALLVWAAILASTQMKPLIKEKIFYWDITPAQPSADVSHIETPQSTVAVQPSKPIAVWTVQTVRL